MKKLLAAFSVLAATVAIGAATSGRPARITSATTYYDRKEGIIYFDKDVYVDDEQYQLHADKAYVFLSGTNDVRRIVAIGNIAMTNDTKRAYGVKVSYYKEGGMVVLYGGEGRPAEVRDESKEQDQVVKGRKIKFWIDSEQVEVMEADIQAPTSGLGDGGTHVGSPEKSASYSGVRRNRTIRSFITKWSINS